MVRIARDRIATLFALAEDEAGSGHPELADRYVVLARRIGMRYNVRLLAEYREVYCRGCSAYWTEGRSVRTRLRSGRRVRTCLRCGREQRTRWRAPGGEGDRLIPAGGPSPVRPVGASVAMVDEDGLELSDSEEPEDP